MECIYTLGTTSAAHTYGNVASFIREYIKQLFPRDFFTYTYVDSKVAWKNINEVLGNGNAEFKTRHYPFLIISPQFNDDDDDTFLANTPLTSNFDNAISSIHRNTIFPLVMDPQHRIELGYRINRDKIDFEVELRLKSLDQQLDVRKFLRNELIWKRPYTVPASLESVIPRSMIEYLGKLAGIDITTDDRSQIPLIMQYLNGHSRSPITYKVRNSTSVEEFFVYYKTNLLLEFNDLARSAPAKKNAVDEYAPLSLKVSCEFTNPGMYALIGTHERKFHGLKFDALVHSPNDIAEMIPMYTYTNLYDRYANDTMDGFSFYSCTVAQTDAEKANEDEIIEMESFIPKDHLKVIETLVKDNVAPETLFRFRLLKNSEEIPNNCDTLGDAAPCEWEVDWRRRRIIIHKSDPLVTYRLLIYANMVVINARYAEMQDKTKTDIPGLR